MLKKQKIAQLQKEIAFYQNLPGWLDFRTCVSSFSNRYFANINMDKPHLFDTLTTIYQLPPIAMYLRKASTTSFLPKETSKDVECDGEAIDVYPIAIEIDPEEDTMKVFWFTYISEKIFKCNVTVANAAKYEIYKIQLSNYDDWRGQLSECFFSNLKWPTVMQYIKWYKLPGSKYNRFTVYFPNNPNMGINVGSVLCLSE